MIQDIKVLMVDDEKQFRKTTEKILKKRGFRTLMAESGMEALEKLKEDPDVIILDIRMPGMDGHETLKEIRKRKEDIPVIMLTGHGDRLSAKEALDEGAYDYLAKPCDMDLLTAKIREAAQHGKGMEKGEEKHIKDVMIAIGDYTTLQEEQTILEAVQSLMRSFASFESTSKLMETGHRSIIVFDNKGEVRGMLAILDLLRAIMPAYLSSPKPSTADSVQYSPLFWSGMFSREVKLLGKRKIRDIMSPAPITIDAGSNLMEAAYVMVSHEARRLVVVESGEVAGVIREQDLFFEMEKILEYDQ